MYGMVCKFRQNLRDELNYQGLTVKELAQKTGIPIRTLENYLGKRDSLPPVDNAFLIASVLGVSLEWLVTGERQPPAQGKTENDYHYLIHDMEKLPDDIKTAVKNLLHYAAEK